MATRAPSPERTPRRAISATISARRRENARRISALMPATSATPWRSIVVEHQPQPGGQLPAQGRLENRFGRVPLPVEGAGVQGGAPPVGTLGDVEDRPVQVDSRVAQAAGAMQEHRAHEPGAGFDEHRRRGRGARSRRVAFEVALDLVAGGVQTPPPLRVASWSLPSAHTKDTDFDGDRVRSKPAVVVLTRSSAGPLGWKPANAAARSSRFAGPAKPSAAARRADPPAGRGSRLREVVLAAVDDLPLVVAQVSGIWRCDNTAGSPLTSGASVWKMLICSQTDQLASVVLVAEDGCGLRMQVLCLSWRGREPAR